MSVSVVIPLYNGAPWIQETISTILAQSLKPDRVIVVDDGSTDESANLARAFPGVEVIPNEGKGSSVARNIGLRYVSSEYVAFLDQDDLWHTSHLKTLTETLTAHPSANTVVATADCFTTDSPRYDDSDGMMHFFDPWTRYPFTIGVEGPSVALHRANVLSTVGLWEECATGMGDALIFLKLAALHPLAVNESCTVGKRIHASQQWLQVRELGVQYLGFRYGVMLRALEFRRNCFPDDPRLDLYSRRLEALRSLQKLTAAIETGKWEDIGLIALGLEERIGDGPIDYLPHAFYCLMGALFKTVDADELQQLRDDVFSKMLAFWPAEAGATRRALQSVIGERPRVS